MRPACSAAESLSTHERSVRNISWSFELWISYFRAAELHRADDQFIKSTVHLMLRANETDFLKFVFRVCRFISTYQNGNLLAALTTCGYMVGLFELSETEVGYQ